MDRSPWGDLPRYEALVAVADPLDTPAAVAAGRQALRVSQLIARLLDPRQRAPYGLATDAYANELQAGARGASRLSGACSESIALSSVVYPMAKKSG